MPWDHSIYGAYVLPMFLRRIEQDLITLDKGVHFCVMFVFFIS